jgi:hypothetical protein
MQATLKQKTKATHLSAPNRASASKPEIKPNIIKAGARLWEMSAEDALRVNFVDREY